MKISDIETGQDLTIEVEWGENKYEIPTKAMGQQVQGVMLRPFTYKGTTIELNLHKFKDMVFNLHGIDPETNTRKVWKNVILEMFPFKGETFYLARVNGFNAMARSSERRQHPRMLIEKAGFVRDNVSEEIPVVVRDISNNGFAFIMDKSNELESNFIKIRFEDSIEGNRFSLQMKGTVVRQADMGDKKLYGCVIVETNRDMFTYICLHRMELMKRE